MSMLFTGQKVHEIVGLLGHIIDKLMLNRIEDAKKTIIARHLQMLNTEPELNCLCTMSIQGPKTIITITVDKPLEMPRDPH